MYISIDLGGTSTRVASSKDLKTIHKMEVFHTEQDLTQEKKLLNKSIANVLDGENVDNISIGVPGIVDRYTRTFKKIVNYPELTGKNYEALFDLNVSNSRIVIENDAALAGLAEANRGEAAEHSVVAYLTLSTGFGGIRIQNKKISRIQGNSEPGHMIIEMNGREDSVCGQKGCVHSYLSGVSFRELYKISPLDCTNPKIWNEYGSRLAIALVNVIAMWNPGIIVLGGGISTRFEMFEPAMHDALSEQNLFEIPKIIKSELHHTNGILGGLDLIKQLF
jgi:glucokinase